MLVMTWNHGISAALPRNHDFQVIADCCPLWPIESSISYASQGGQMKPDETLVGWATAADPITGITAVLPIAEGAKEHDACSV